MFAVPSLTAVTSPVVDTVATPVLSELQAIVRPVNVLPPASRVTALACAVSTAVMELGASATVTEVTGTGVTVRVALPAMPSLVAVIVAVPVATAVTTPSLATVATLELSELQVTTRPVSTSLLVARVVAEAWVVSPAVSEDLSNETLTDATGTRVTVNAALPLTPSLVAVICTVPTPSVVTRPVAETLATAILSDAHVIARPASTAPVAS